MLVRPIGISLFLLASGCSPALQDPAAQTSTLGLVQVPNQNFNSVHALPDIDWSRYQSVFIASPSVEFDRGWQANQSLSDPRRVTSSDTEIIKQRLSKQVVDAFATEISRNTTLSLVEEPTPESLTLKPDISKLRISNPVNNEGYQITVLSENSGSMTITITITDSADGTMLMRLSDRARGLDYTDYRQQEVVKNRKESQQIFRNWARQGIQALKDQSK